MNIEDFDLPQALTQSIDNIDAYIFTGDQFNNDPKLRAAMREMIDRWERGLKEKAKTYVTFGQEHTHRVSGHTLDKDCVACFYADNAVAGRAKAFDIFGRKFCFEYWEDVPDMRFFPRGLIEID